MSAVSVQTDVLVVGAGAMGSGIAQVAALAGHRVYLADTSAEAVEKGCATIAASLREQVSKGRLDAARAESTIARIHGIDKLADARTATLAIEAIVERLDVKRALFFELESILPEQAILASNTSSLSITALTAGLSRPERVVGMHFFNPAPRMKLVEVVSGLATDADVADTVFATAVAWGKVAVHVVSSPGFIVNRVARPFYAEAQRVLAERAAKPATLDAAMRDCCGFPMGPFELMDFIGHDVNFAVTRSVFDACFGDRRYEPSLFQQELVAAGRLGRKSGRGVYEYRAGAVPPRPEDESPREGAERVRLHGAEPSLCALADRLGAVAVVERMGGAASRESIEIEGAHLVPCDGRTATRRAAEEDCPNLIVFDLCLDYASTPRLVIAPADQCAPAALDCVVGTLQRAGLAVSLIDDVAGLIGLRTVAMIINEAAGLVQAGIATAHDVDAAMRYGTNYPRGPLAWADQLGVARVVAALDRLNEHYREERYRCAPLLRRMAIGGRKFHE